MNQMNRNRIESAMKSFLACMMKLAKDTAALACALNSIKKVLCMLPHADVLMGCRMPGLLLNGIWLRGTSVRCIFAWPSVLVMMSTPSPRHEGCQTCKWQKRELRFVLLHCMQFCCPAVTMMHGGQQPRAKGRRCCRSLSIEFVAAFPACRSREKEYVYGWERVVAWWSLHI